MLVAVVQLGFAAGLTYIGLRVGYSAHKEGSAIDDDITFSDSIRVYFGLGMKHRKNNVIPFSERVTELKSEQKKDVLSGK